MSGQELKNSHKLLLKRSMKSNLYTFVHLGVIKDVFSHCILDIKFLLAFVSTLSTLLEALDQENQWRL